MTKNKEIAGIKGSFEDINSFMDYCYNQERERIIKTIKEKQELTRKSFILTEEQKRERWVELDELLEVLEK